MDFHQFFHAIETSQLGNWINTADAAYPIIESFHVLAVALVFGTILIVDLRLLGLASNNRPFTSVARDLLKFTWGGFALAVTSGILLFVPAASLLYQNTEFQTKMVLLLLAGVNMAIFELVTARNVSVWDHHLPPPVAARIAGLLSIGFWIAIIIYGRLIGFVAIADDPFAFL